MSDFVGIFMANRKDDQFKAFLLATIRIAFIPLFLICKRNIEGKIFPTYIEYDAAVICEKINLNFRINGRDMRDTSAAYLVAACGVGSGMAEISELGILNFAFLDFSFHLLYSTL
ncbi:hypothetical protein HZS_6678 [Henneguya salminicola]|nr:hypothetical protein HZS_6678 [Henneguya salminicola]